MFFIIIIIIIIIIITSTELFSFNINLKIILFQLLCLILTWDESQDYRIDISQQLMGTLIKKL